MKRLSFAIKANMNRPPRIHVQSADKKTTFGSFSANDTAQFENWDRLGEEETIELQQYINNLKAIERYFSTKALKESTDFRIRLPSDFIKAIEEISMLCLDEPTTIDVHGIMINAAIQHLKIISARLPPDKKQQALQVLSRLNLSENVKIDISSKIQAVFSELLSIHNKSEKLHQKAILLFEKDKSIAPKTIEEIANGGLSTPRWLVACAIDVLLDEKPQILEKLLCDDDLQFLWWSPLIKNGNTMDDLMVRLDVLQHSESIKRKLTKSIGNGA